MNLLNFLALFLFAQFALSQYGEETALENLSLGYFKIISEPTGYVLTQCDCDRTRVSLYPYWEKWTLDGVWRLEQTNEGGIIMENANWVDWLRYDQSNPTEVIGSPEKEESSYYIWVFEYVSFGKYLIRNAFSNSYLTQALDDPTNVYLQFDRALATNWTTATNII